MDNKFINEALRLYRLAADERAFDAGMGGRHDDGGCANMKAMADAYEAGLKQQIPNFLAGYVREQENLADPEYKEFIRLKAKFKE